MKILSISRIVLYKLFGAVLFLSIIAPRIPALIETIYSQTVYLWIAGPLSLFTGIFPFSVAEIAIAALIIAFLYKIILLIKSLIKTPGAYSGSWRKKITGPARILMIIFIVFMIFWGFNYNRVPFGELAGLQVEPDAATVDELAGLALHLTYRANELRELVKEDERGVMTLPGGIGDMFERAEKGYERASLLYPELGGKFGRPKGVILSRLLSYMGISGVYIPFTAEANVNIEIPHVRLPATTAHEMAHQRGFAREDEANYIAYLICMLHPDPDFQYSGTVLALRHTMNALEMRLRMTYPVMHEGLNTAADDELITKTLPSVYDIIVTEYSEGLQRDMQELQDYRERFEGPVNSVFTAMNNAYLLANRQQDGVQSYGRMVDLLLAEYRTGIN